LPQLGSFHRVIRGDIQHPHISRGLFEMISARIPDFSRDLIIEVEPSPILAEAKSKMESVGIENLNDIGPLRLDRNLAINRPGLLSTRRARTLLAESFRMGKIRPLGAPNIMMMASVSSWPQKESVIIADELDLNDHVITIHLDHVSHLWIIARKIKARSGALITYTPQTNPHVGVSGQRGSPDPARPNYDRTARQSSSNHDRAARGGDGAHGGDGRAGPRGEDAPSLTIIALEIDAMPDIELPGQRGGRGGAGGRGARGGDGQRGKDSRSGGLACLRSVGYGGHGGDGGDGGRGGQGGDGGDGGAVTISTTADQLEGLMTARPFTPNTGPGPGGEPGAQGTPGERGRGGQAGHATFPCREHSARRGSDGQRGNSLGDMGRGSPGSASQLAYGFFDPEDWDRILHAPYIQSINPVESIAGGQVVVHGLHFTSAARVHLGGSPVSTTFNHEGQLSFRVPAGAAGGSHAVKVDIRGGETSNEVPLRVLPHIRELRAGGTPVDGVAPGDRLELVGTSFDAGATVVRNGEYLPGVRRSSSSIEIELPREAGVDGGGKDRFEVQNSDGYRSAEWEVQRLPSVDSGFRVDEHGYPFHNFTIGDPTWGAFMETFGTVEVGAQSLLHPVMTSAFYAFFRWFLTNNAHCTGLASTSLKRFHEGDPGPFGEYISTVGITKENRPDPPDIPADLWRQLTVAQGRVISRELVIHYADQGREGLSRVERSLREIEADLGADLGAGPARVLCYIPSGSTWDIMADAEVREAFMRSHCVTPTRLVYGDDTGSLDGARLYVYENNAPGRHDRFIEFFMQDGELHFEAPYSESDDYPPYATAHGFTLGTNTIQSQLLDNVSMPISGAHTATAGLMRFALELVLSPARVSVEEESGKVLGYRDGRMHSDPGMGYVCPWLENYLLVREDVASPVRTIHGDGDGTYTYMSLLPDGKSLVIRDADCTAATLDRVRIGPDFDWVEVVPSESKTLDLHLGEELTDGTARHLRINVDLQSDETLNLSLAPGLDGLEISGLGREISLDVEARLIAGDSVLREGILHGILPADANAVLGDGMWANVENLQMEIR